MLKMGGMRKLLGMLPGAHQFEGKIDEADTTRKIKHQIALINAMTPEERYDPKILNASRKRRIAKGSGLEVPQLNLMLKQYDQMQKLFKQMRKKKGLFKRM
jgi:signal recognition particle subunit SRP54